MNLSTVKYSISVEASTANLAEVRKFVTLRSEEHQIPQKAAADITLAVDEAYTNIIKHAYRSRNQKPVNIEIGFDEKQIRIKITDEGESFNLDEYSKPDIVERIKNKQRGGMGVYLIRELMDQVTYKRVGEKNEIEMIKLL